VEIFLYLVHIAVCFVLIMVVLLQSGKAADLAGAFGGGGSQTALGSRGAATVLTKATTICAILFMLTSLGLALYGSNRSGSVLEEVPIAEPAPETAPEPASSPEQVPVPDSETPPAADAASSDGAPSGPATPAQK